MTKKKSLKKTDDSEKPKEQVKLTHTWNRRIKASQKHLKQNSASWNDNERLLYGRLGEKKSDFDLAIGWGLCQFLISQIWYQNPEIIVQSKTDMQPDARTSAKLLTQVCQYDADEMDLKSAGHLALQNNFDCGYGWIIEDYENQIVEMPKEEKKGDDADEEADIDVKEQNYCFRHGSPRDLLVDPDGIRRDLSDHKYIAVAFYPTISQLRDEKEEKYQWLPDDIDHFKASNPSKSRGPEEPDLSINMFADEKDPDFKQIKVWEIWDKINMDVLYFTDDRKQIIGKRKGGWPVKFSRSGREMFPVTVEMLLQQPKGWYGIPFLDLISPQIINMMKIQKFFIVDATTKWRKWIAPSGLIPPDKLAKILDTDNIENTVIEVEKDTLSELVEGPHPYPNLRELVAPLEDVSIKPDYIAAFEVLMNQIQQIVGFADTARGGLPKTRSAREAMAVLDKQQARVAPMADAVASFTREVMEKHIQCLQQTILVERYVKVVDDEKRIETFKQYTKNDIQGKFYFNVLTGSSMPKDTNSAKQQFIQFMQMFVPFLQKEGYSIAPIVYEASEMFHIHDVDAFFRNQKQAAKMVAQILYAVANGIKPGGKEIPPKALVEAASSLVSSTLSQAEIKQAGDEVKNAGGGGQAPDKGQVGMRGESNASQAAVPG